MRANSNALAKKLAASISSGKITVGSRNCVDNHLISIWGYLGLTTGEFRRADVDRRKGVNFIEAFSVERRCADYQGQVGAVSSREFLARLRIEPRAKR